MRNFDGSNVVEMTGEFASGFGLGFRFLEVHTSRSVGHYLLSERRNKSPSNIHGGANIEEDFAEECWIHDDLVLYGVRSGKIKSAWTFNLLHVLQLFLPWRFWCLR